MNTGGIAVIDDAQTARYVAFNDADKSLVMAMADMDFFEKRSLCVGDRWRPIIDRCRPRWLAIDGNWSANAIGWWIREARRVGANIAFEPVSVEKSSRIFSEASKRSSAEDPSFETNDLVNIVDLTTPNFLELEAMLHEAPRMDLWDRLVRGIEQADLRKGLQSDGEKPSEPFSAETIAAALRLLPIVPHILTKDGANGVLLTEIIRLGDQRLLDPLEDKYIVRRTPHIEAPNKLQNVAGFYVRQFRPKRSIATGDIVNVNGAGDTFLGVLLAGLSSRAIQPLPELIDLAMKGAWFTLQSREAVSPAVRSLASEVVAK